MVNYVHILWKQTEIKEILDLNNRKENPDPSLVKKLYLMLKRDADVNNSHNNLNWSYHVKHTLNEIDMTNLSFNLDTLPFGNIHIFCRVTRKRSDWTNVQFNAGKLTVMQFCNR